jgi:hypothetical protein
LSKSIDYTISYSSSQGSFDLCKIILGGDGSYYVTAPYHPHNRALLALWTVNYARRPDLLSLRNAVEVAVLDDDDHRLKLSHHPDGFLQFSGEGIKSGKDAKGRIRGLGTQSWPLRLPTLGPSFGLALMNPEKSGRPATGKKQSITFHEDDLDHLRAADVMGVLITGYYLPLHWREFVQRRADGHYEIGLVNPGAQAVLNLRVLLASKDSDYPAMIGLQARPHTLELPGTDSGFMLTSATGNLRRAANGDLVGDQLVCIYPRPEGHEPLAYMSLNYPLPAPSYTAPPWYRRVMRRLWRSFRGSVSRLLSSRP